VLIVQQPVAGYWDYPVLDPGDGGLVEQARKMAQEQTDGALEKAGPVLRPASGHLTR
jgi:hypothetical protein